MESFVSEPLSFERLEPSQMQREARAFRDRLGRRRSVRHFSSLPLPDGVLESCILAAGSAPSGAHMQPWTFVLVTDQALKTKIRAAAEEEERKSYGGRMNEEWLRDLAPLGTTPDKPFLEEAPALIVLFRQSSGRALDGSTKQHYYSTESIGIAAGFLLAALHFAGLATLTHTPSPMAFLTELLERPASEKPFLLIPVGYPAEGCRVPKLERKALEQILVRR